MSEVREVFERTFSGTGKLSALSEAAFWVEENAVDVDSVVGDADYVMVYYTESKTPAEPEVQGPGTEFWEDAYISPFAPVYTLRGRTV